MKHTMMQQALSNIHEVKVMHSTWIPGFHTVMTWPDLVCLLLYAFIIGWIILKLVAYIHMILWSIKNFGLLKTVFFLSTFNRVMKAVDANGQKQ